MLYTGLTDGLKTRVYEHREKLVNGFTKKYEVTKFVYYEVFDNAGNAILGEKQIKGGSRRKRVELVTSMNREWQDLYEQF